MTRVPTITTLAVMFFIAASVTSVRAQPDQQIIQGGGARQGGPPRDPRAPVVTGTAAIRGRIFASDTGRPLRRARIQVTAPELAGDERMTSTNAEGRYEIK